MTQRKYYTDYETFYEVTFLSNEHPDFREDRPETHTAVVYCEGYWCFCIMIDGKPANSLRYASPKTAVKNSWIIK